MSTEKTPIREPGEPRTSRDNFAGNQGQGLPATFYVFFVKNGSPEQLHVDTVSATNADEAMRSADAGFVDATVITVCRMGDTSSKRNLPRARFINGRFLPADLVEGDLAWEFA